MVCLRRTLEPRVKELSWSGREHSEGRLSSRGAV